MSRDAMIEAAAIIAADANRMVDARKTAERVLDAVRPLILREAAEVARGEAICDVWPTCYACSSQTAAEALERLADGNTTTANDSAGGEST